MLTIEREAEQLGGAYVRVFYVDDVRVATIAKATRCQCGCSARGGWFVKDRYEYNSSDPHWIDAVAYTDSGERKAYETLSEASDAVRHAYAAPTNRYTELSATQQAHVDRYINALASGGQTAVTQHVKAFAEEARTALTRLETATDNIRTESYPHVEDEIFDGSMMAEVLTDAQNTCGKVRHALAMIVDSTVRLTH